MSKSSQTLLLQQISLIISSTCKETSTPTTEVNTSHIMSQDYLCQNTMTLGRITISSVKHDLLHHQVMLMVPKIIMLLYVRFQQPFFTQLQWKRMTQDISPAADGLRLLSRQVCFKHTLLISPLISRNNF